MRGTCCSATSERSPTKPQEPIPCQTDPGTALLGQSKGSLLTPATVPAGDDPSGQQDRHQQPLAHNTCASHRPQPCRAPGRPPPTAMCIPSSRTRMHRPPHPCPTTPGGTQVSPLAGRSQSPWSWLNGQQSSLPACTGQEPTAPARTPGPTVGEQQPRAGPNQEEGAQASKPSLYPCGPRTGYSATSARRWPHSPDCVLGQHSHGQAQPGHAAPVLR